MPCWSARGQTEPIAALVAVFALGAGLTLYAGVVDAVLPALAPEAGIAPTATDTFVREASSFGAVDPPIADAVEAARPRSYAMNATVRADGGSWTAGPAVPERADCERRSVAVRSAPGVVRPGRTEVCLWTER